MTVFLVLCFLFPIALLAQASLNRDGALSRLLEWPSRATVAQLLLFVAGSIVVATSVAAMIEERPFLFDDSFISYRYAKNLATGHGLTWNPGEAPSEGYTNLLLVLLVAPVIKLGGDPLLAARVISIAAAAGMVLVVYFMARRELGSNATVAALLATGVLTFSLTAELTMLGLETVAFAFALFLAYDLSQRFLETDDRKLMLASGGVTFLAFILRPEAVFLPVALVAAQVLVDRKRLFRVVGLLALSFGIPLALYLGWKLWYFGTIIPNPALVKMPGKGLIRPRGLSSITDFLALHQKLLLMAGIGLLYSKGRVRAALTCSLMVVIYILFYLRVDTLMDMHNRFLYPAFPFLLVIALPGLKAFIDTFLEWKQASPIRLSLGVLLFLIVFYPNPGLALRRVAGGMQGEVASREVHQASLMLRHVGTELAQYPLISQVTIGSTDAGLLPYISGARHVDMAGLTTRFIAEHKDVKVASDYFFAQKPDLVIVRARIGGQLVDYEHGVLGDYPKWAHNPGWNDYKLGGAVHNGPRHDLYFFLRKQSEHEQALEKIIQKVADPDIGPLQTRLGSAQ